MKKKIFVKRFLALLIGLCLCLCVFAACSGNVTDSADDSEQNEETPPTKPDGDENSEQTPPDKPDGGEGDGGQTPPDKPDGNGGGSSSVSYTAANEYTADVSIANESFSSTGTDENVIWVSANIKAVFDGIAVNSASSSSTGGDNSSFYGVGAAILATDGTAYIKSSEITTDAKGGAGAFAYGDGIIYIKDTTIFTEQSTSGGIHVAGGGTLYAWDLTVETNGASSAAIRSDRGGGTMVVDGGTYTSNGSGSPAVYCTADIAVNGATLTANGSEGVCIEGLNSLYLFGCDLTANMPDDSQNDTSWGVIVYQSMSGDSEVGNSTLQMVGGSLTVNNGGVFYTTNTESHIYLNNVAIVKADESEFFLQCTGNSNQRGWGSTGSNGADCTFTAENQQMDGNIVWDSISTLDLYLVGSSTLEGAIVDDETWAGNGGNGYCNVYIDEDSVWTVTDDSEVTNLCCAGKIEDENGNTVTIKDADDNVLVSGTSDCTVTVLGTYSQDVDLSGADTATSFDDFAVEVPDELE